MVKSIGKLTDKFLNAVDAPLLIFKFVCFILIQQLVNILFTLYKDFSTESPVRCYLYENKFFQSLCTYHLKNFIQSKKVSFAR